MDGSSFAELARYVYVYKYRGLTNYFDELQRLTSFVRDQAGRVLYQTNANLETLAFTYYPDDQLKTLTDGRNVQTSWARDAYGRVSGKTLLANQGGAAQEVLRYYYDAESQLTNRWSLWKGGAGANTYYAYDPAGNLTNVAYPTLTNRYQYDALNQLTNMVDAAGSTAFTWTDGGQLLSESGRWTSDKVTFGYQHRKRSSLSLQRPGTSDWTQSYQYGDYGRLESTTSPAGTFGYVDYYTLDLWRQLNLPNSTQITHTYDGLSRLASTTLGASAYTEAHDYLYDTGSQRTQHVESVFRAGWSSFNTNRYTYDNIGQLKTAKGYDYLLAMGGGVGGPRLHEQFGYAYDASGNLAWRTNNNLKLRFQANGLNQLTNVSRTGTLTVAGTLPQPSYTASVSVSGTGLSTTPADLYDDGAWASQNAATLADGLNTYTATVTDNGQTAQQTVTAFLPANLNFQYDGNGNLTNDGVRTFEYDFENQLTNIFVPAAWRSQFQYDGLGRRRVSKEYSWNGSAWSITNEVRYIYDGRVVLQERDGSNNPQVTYTRGLDLSGSLQGAGGIGGLLARTDSSGHAYYHCDANGNIICMLNSSQQVVAHYRYDPYGNLLAMTGPLAAANLYRFSSKECHPNSGLVYYLYRYYDPNLQRWPNRDPFEEEGGYNLYGFVLGDPLNRFDPFGLYESCMTLRATVPGQVSWDYAVTCWQDGQYGNAVGWGCSMLGEQVLFVVSLGRLNTAPQAARQAAIVAEATAAARADRLARLESALQEALLKRESTRAALKQAAEVLNSAEENLKSKGGALSEEAKNLWRSAQGRATEFFGYAARLRQSLAAA